MHWLSSVTLRICCWAQFAAMHRAGAPLLLGGRRCRSISPASTVLSSKRAVVRQANDHTDTRTDRQTDRQTNGHTDARQFHRPCFAYYADSVSTAWYLRVSPPTLGKLTMTLPIRYSCSRSTTHHGNAWSSSVHEYLLPSPSLALLAGMTVVIWDEGLFVDKLSARHARTIVQSSFSVAAAIVTAYGPTQPTQVSVFNSGVAQYVIHWNYR